jgi:hypothetical protein
MAYNVNAGDLNVEVPVEVKDELGFLLIISIK